MMNILEEVPEKLASNLFLLPWFCMVVLQNRWPQDKKRRQMWVVV